MSEETWKVELEETFKRFDSDGNGRIDLDEFNGLLNALGSKLSVEDRELGFKIIDKDDSGSITHQELAVWWDVVRDEAQV